MLKSTIKKSGAVAFAGIIAAGAILTTGAVAVTAAPNEAETPVMYDSRQVLPDGNGEYGMIIPTAISFDDGTTQSNADVEIAAIGGHDLKEWKNLSVETSVKSKNAYKLLLNGTEATKFATYTLNYTGNAADFDANDTAQQITKKLGVGGDNQEKVTGLAKLGDKSAATTKGQYKDTLTYSFNEIANEKN